MFRTVLLWCFACVFCASSMPGLGRSVYARASGNEKLIWADEFSKPSGTLDRLNWAYQTGGGGWGNHELETYCSPASVQTPCATSRPNSFVGTDGLLHVVALRNAAGEWTSARLSTQGLHSFQYGRIEARIKVPAGTGLWPAFWMLGDSIDAVKWPACGELDIMENVGRLPAQINGSIHGVGFTGTPLTTIHRLTSGEAFAQNFHTYGMVWAPGKIQYYVDDPLHPYVTYGTADLPAGAIWPFDGGKFFLMLNLAVGGDWPQAPDASMPASAEMLVDYVRVYQVATSK